MALASRTLDPESAEWLRALAAPGAEGDAAARRLHALLVPIARSAALRRGSGARIGGPELDDLVHQAAADAQLAIMAKLDQFRGESRFTTWAYKFVIFEVSAAFGRHFWTRPGVAFEAEDWERLPDRLGLDPVRKSEWRDLVDALRRSIDEDLSARQRAVFVAIVLNGVPLDALAAKLGSNRNAIYKSLFDARVKVHRRLVADGHLDPQGTVPA
jgi:RNA polymerase sigma-70 factor (ECF subfamily)